MELVEVIKDIRIHALHMDDDPVHRQKHLFYRVGSVDLTLITIFLNIFDIVTDDGIYQLILVFIPLVNGFFGYPKAHSDVVHGNRTDTILHEQVFGLFPDPVAGIYYIFHCHIETDKATKLRKLLSRFKFPSSFSTNHPFLGGECRGSL
jgi:hypothetical protein